MAERTTELGMWSKRFAVIVGVSAVLPAAFAPALLHKDDPIIQSIHASQSLAETAARVPSSSELLTMKSDTASIRRTLDSKMQSIAKAMTALHDADAEMDVADSGPRR